MEIIPFRGLRFNQSVVGNVGDCIAPPYDVIDSDMQEALYAKNQYNIVRVIRGKTSEQDGPENNQYTRAAEFMKNSIQDDAFLTDSKPTIYAYVQDFTISEKTFRRSGFVALGKLEDFGKGIKAHEKTLDGPKADRLNLMRATGAQFGQIFMLYDDSQKIADEIIAGSASRSALVDFVDDSEVRHRLYAIDEPDDVGAIIKMMLTKAVVIADGHHRYETALNYYKETQNPAAQYRMMTFVNMQNEGLIVLPTHRLVGGLKDFSMQKLIADIEADFEVTRYSFSGSDDKCQAREKMFVQMRENFAKSKTCFGIYAANSAFYAACLKNDKVMDDSFGQMSTAARRLDVNVLHKLILEHKLGIGEEQLAGQTNIEYIKDIGDAIDKSIAKVDSGKHHVVFFMNPTKIQQVKAVAMAGEKMPQKSTFFYPKIFTGMVINKL